MKKKLPIFFSNLSIGLLEYLNLPYIMESKIKLLVEYHAIEKEQHDLGEVSNICIF
jgi:hypothetical protein